MMNYRQENPVIGAGEPWSDKFDPTMIWGLVAGTMFYIGLHWNLKG